MYNTQEIANRIKQRTNETGTSMKKMLADLGMGINSISQFAKGTAMSCISLAQIADYLDCSVDYLLGKKQTSLDLSAHEKELIIAYRQHIEMQSAIDKLLGIEQKEKEQSIG